MQCDVQPAAPREFRRAEGAVEAPVTGTCRRGRSDTSIGSGWRPLVLLDTFGHFWTVLDTFQFWFSPSAAAGTRFFNEGRRVVTGIGQRTRMGAVQSRFESLADEAAVRASLASGHREMATHTRGVRADRGTVGG